MHGARPSTADVDVLIVGAGISGIGMAAHLRRKCPGKTFAIVDRRSRPGGTWDLFRYPGIRSDSDMYTLGFEFEPWRDGNSIADGDTILAYLDRVIDEHGLREAISLGWRVVSAGWDSEAGLWNARLQDETGKERDIAARFLFLGAGYYDYDEPYNAPIPGIDGFGGETIHPQFWPQDFDAAGKRIAVIGSGATAATIVPALAATAAHITMVQRTPTWYMIAPARDRIANTLKAILPARLAHRLTRFKNSRLQNWFIKRSRRKPASVAEYLKRKVRDQLGEQYREADFDPPYNPWDQRACLVPDGDLFTAIREGRAAIATGEIETVEKDGILLKDGQRIAADAIVTATGLKLATLGKIEITLDGEPLRTADRFYYRNCMFSGVPNMAALFGYLNAAWTLRVDMVADWLCRLFNQMDAWGVDMVTPEIPADMELTEDDPFWGFSSGYLARGRSLVPKSATEEPWRLSMDYFADRREMRQAPIDDGNLVFCRLGADMPDTLEAPAKLP